MYKVVYVLIYVHVLNYLCVYYVYWCTCVYVYGYMFVWVHGLGCVLQCSDPFGEIRTYCKRFRFVFADDLIHWRFNHCLSLVPYLPFNHLILQNYYRLLEEFLHYLKDKIKKFITFNDTSESAIKFKETTEAAKKT